MSIWAGSRRALVARSAGPSLPVVAASARPIDRAASSDLAAGQLEERHARLAVVPVLVRPFERLCSAVKVADSQPDFTDRVVGVADSIKDPEALKFFAGLARLLLGFGPKSSEHLELGAMNTADARGIRPRIGAASSARPRRPIARRA